MMDESNTFDSVGDYLDQQPDAVREKLLELKACILKAAPEAIELINYNIPAYSLVKGGKRDQQIMIAGYPKHVGLYPHPSVIEKFDKALAGYKKGKGSVQFRIDEPLPHELIVEMVMYRKKLLRL